MVDGPLPVENHRSGLYMDAGCCSGAHPRLGAPFPIEKDDLSGEGGSILTARSRRSVLGVRWVVHQHPRSR
ncbi:Hypothetical protein NTJ_03182 [Nesidiocoris tenuis]|uniref:Uncharacterized protein n=1 Tax=Nesidiocoris tenuis TaxID=355587 RepID=A0ABN7AGP8_9HEMI|nr:Hypothetical protein NTJ_03182 [Nesidiocoris tenuis]